MKNRDEDYIVDLCDRVLQLVSKRQGKFNFLRGDAQRSGRKGRKLPVDAFYSEINLVIEYREKQHAESVPFFDKPNRLTCSGCSRDEQRKRYDERRRRVLPQHGIRILELDYNMFRCNGRKRLCRDEAADQAIIRKQLKSFLGDLRP